MKGLGLISGLLVLVGARFQEVKDPQELLTTYLSDIQKAVKNTTGGAKVGANTVDRAKLLQVAKTAFERQSAGAVPKVPHPIWDYHRNYLENLVKADKFFANEDFRPERQNWMTACKTTLQRNITHAKDPETPYTTDQVFESMIDAVSMTKKSFTLGGVADLRSAGLGGVKTISQYVIAKATVPPNRDSKQHFTERLARIDKAFPVANENDQMGNQEAQTILKAGAKSLFDRELAASLAK